MGGKKRGAPRQRKRADQAAEDLADASAEAQSTALVEGQSNKELFVLDTAPEQSVLSKKEKRRLEEERRLGKETAKARRCMSEKEKKQVSKLIKNLGGDAERIASHAEEGRRRMGTQKPTRDGTLLSKGLGITRQEVSFDLWSTEPEQSKKKSLDKNSSQTRKTTAVDVAQGGQSYHPDEEQHQNIIGEALALEISRNEAIQIEKAPVSKGMSEETLAVLIDSDDEAHESEEEDNAANEEDAIKSFKPRKTKEKLTKAQRNKQKRHKRLELELRRRKEEKKLLNSVNEAHKVKKQLDREERERKAAKAEISRLKEEEASKPLGANLHESLVKKNPIKAPSLPVALTSELDEGGGSLRTMRPKGCLLEERHKSLILRKMAHGKSQNVRRVVEGKRRKTALGSDFMLH